MTQMNFLSLYQCVLKKSFFLKTYISLSFPSFRCRLCLYAMPWCGCTFLESNPQPPLSPMCGCLFPFKTNIAMMPLTQYSTFLSKYDSHIIFHKSTNPSSAIHPSSRIFLLKRTKVKASQFGHGFLWILHQKSDHQRWKAPISLYSKPILVQH